MTEKIDLRTPAEKERDERNARMAEQYKELRKQNPDASVQRICKAVAEQNGLSLPSVKNIMKTMGVIQTSFTSI